MFKTIFSKLMAIFILILFIAFAAAGISLSLFLDNYVTNQKSELLSASCDEINSVFEEYLLNSDNPYAEIYISNTLRLYGSYTNSIIWIVTQNGIIYKSNLNMDASAFDNYRNSNGRIQLPEIKQFSKVMVEPWYVKEVGSFYGFFSDPYFEKHGNQWLTIQKSYSYTIKNTNKEERIAVFMHTPVPEVQNVRTKVLIFFFISVGIAVIISIVLVYIFSRRFVKPLKQIKNAAKSIAGGEFKKRLIINSNDEIGELATVFNQMAMALENLEEMRRGFIANVSHELRTPMTSIRGFIEGILDGTIPPERQSQYLTIVRDESNRLNRLVNNLLDLARMEAGEVKLVMKPFDINELVRRCVIKLETLLVNKNITVEARFDEEILPVNADADAIDRVIYNLLHNAIKFTPQDGNILILVETQKDKVRVSVEDTGSGIDSSELDMIWERFYKSDKSRSRDKSGTGLGLAIVKNIINEHEQEIWVESELGKGTKFTFTIARAEKIREVDTLTAQ